MHQEERNQSVLSPGQMDALSSVQQSRDASLACLGVTSSTTSKIWGRLVSLRLRLFVCFFFCAIDQLKSNLQLFKGTNNLYVGDFTRQALHVLLERLVQASFVCNWLDCHYQVIGKKHNAIWVLQGMRLPYE